MKLNTIDLKRVTARLHPEDQEWLEREALKNLTSVNAEIVRAIRARMEAERQRA